MSCEATAAGGCPASVAPPGDQVLRGEAFSAEHLELHARRLAAEMGSVDRDRGDPSLLWGLERSGRVLREVHRELLAAVQRGEPITVDAEWLLDNFSVAQDQLREIREDLPRGYYRDLPKIRGGRPRVYFLSLELIVHTDSALDEETLVRFLQAFQESAPLSIGEIWAVPIMLRLALVENLRRLALHLQAHRACRATASAALARLQAKQPLDIDLTSLQECAPVVLELLEMVQDQGPEGGQQLKHLEQWLAEEGVDADQLVRLAHQQQAANQVSIGNVITSMRLISALDWTAFFERTSHVERILRQDPAAVYPRMDAATRDEYRHVVEFLARHSRHTEAATCEAAIQLAREAVARQRPLHEQHIGYYLVDQGRERLERTLGVRLDAVTWLRRNARRHPAALYLGAIALVSLAGVLSVAGPVWISTHSWPLVLILAALAAVPASELAISLVNYAVSQLFHPQRLPKLELRDGVPASSTTLLVVPALLTGSEEIRALIERLELHFLSNPEANLWLALVTDYVDADAQTLPQDARLLAETAQGIRALNERYAAEGEGRFLLLHRQRQWNPSEGRWMGWERKRGKLMQLNQLLLGDKQSAFATTEGNIDAIMPSSGQPRIRFVITLDSDARLPPGAARRLIGALAHPLNQPRFDQRGNIEGGYAILQPRVGVHLPSANRSRYSRLWANSPGLDPYATAASDVYQDLFDEGSYTGKGIYDLAAFERSLEGVFPENHILSHDLIEGCHSRVGLVSDIELIDGFPARYDVESRRGHRWVRGDWQLLPWLLPWVPSERGWTKNRLSLLARWKIFDNLRRSLVAPLLLLLLVAGLMLAPHLAPLWVAALLFVVASPLLVHVLAVARGWPRGLSWAEYRRGWSGDLLRSVGQAGMSLAVLPHRAWTMVDAIARTLTRLLVTRRHLLEWETAAATEQRLSNSGSLGMLALWPPPVLGIGLLVLLPLESKLWAGPLIAAWLAAPALTWWLSKPVPTRREGLKDHERRELRRLVLKTWSYFERFVNAEGNWLPPDNFQEYPSEKIAYRISPTNEGLFLVSALVARDFGLVSLESLVTMWERNLQSWGQLNRLRGHFYNWYDTTTLQALHPRYLSTVDSGNLAACFLTVIQGIGQLRQEAIYGPAQWRGIVDRAAAAEEARNAIHPPGARLISQPLEAIGAALQKLQTIDDSPADMRTWQLRLHAAQEQLALVAASAADLERARSIPWSELPDLVKGLIRLAEDVNVEFQQLFPWVATLAHPPTDPHRSAAGREAMARLTDKLLAADNLAALIALPSAIKAELALLREETTRPEAAGALLEPVREWFDSLAKQVDSASSAATDLDARLAGLADRMEAWAREMDFRFLYNPQRRLFAIGFNIEDGQLDRAHYDMLASEARLASYLAIAKGDVDHRTWFRMGRPMAAMSDRVGLLSWGGTMFEYLMPNVFQRQYAGSLLSESCQAAVLRQIEFGEQQQVPWGVSESAFSALAANSDYHYRSFGVPGLGMKRGLAKDLVVSPYSTFLALSESPQAAYANVQLLAKEGGLGRFGYYDAIDYTPERMPKGKRSLSVRCYMAHHQGMTLAALSNFLDDNRLQRRFHSHPLGRAAELLLQERSPAAVPLVELHESSATAIELPRAESELVSRRLAGYETATPRTHLLSNGNYSVMLTSTGGGYSRFRDIAVTRWRSDPTSDNWGQFLYLRDLRTGAVWSATYQPTRARPAAYDVTYSIDKAEYHRRDGFLETHLEVAVSPEAPAEMRLLKVTNYGPQAAEIEVTSYAEVVLVPPSADEAHPAFHKLFIETEFVADELALLARRRPRDAAQPPAYAVHVLAPGASGVDQVSYESSRERFLGRGRMPAAPAAMDADAALSGTTGAVLDPIFALRARFVVQPQQTATLAFTTAVAASREEALAMADQFHELRVVQRAFEMAWAYSQVDLRHLHLAPANAHLFQRLASALLYPDPAWRADAQTLAANRQGQSGLWRYGISGDFPITLVRLTRQEQLELVRELLTAHQYWRSHGLTVDVVIVNDHPGSYLDALQEQLTELINELHRTPEGQAPHVYLLRGAQMSREDQTLLAAAAAIVLRPEIGSLSKQVEWAASQAASAAPRPAPRPRIAAPLAGLATTGATTSREDRSRGRTFFNGVGGFLEGERAYQIDLRGGRRTPQPWSNVIANPRFGCLVTESGGGYTWTENSREMKLTPWTNDPVIDLPSEWLYVRDEASGALYRPLPQPGRPRKSDYVIEHLPGESRFLHWPQDLEFETRIAVAVEDPVKFIRVIVSNRARQTRTLALTYYVDWVLGVHRRDTQAHIATSIEPSGALVARNQYHPEYPEHIAFLQVLGAQRSVTGDRTEFVGRNGDPTDPTGLWRSSLSGKCGAGLDPCGAVQAKLVLAPGQRGEVVFLLGAGASHDEVREILGRYASPASVAAECARQADHWDDALSRIQVRTPNAALDRLVNGWLVYQTMSCRLWARSAYYQAGGAYGFRDQLQDSMALVYCRPDLVREHILRCAARQFEEGDVQHWWHPPTGRGTRTRFSDDYLWLPLAACHYVRVTGDRSIWDDPAPLLSSPPLEPDEHERYEHPAKSGRYLTLYEHCRLMFDRAFRLGPHGLPLMGCGDWNDGMNKVGALGQGESVWVGWFLRVVLGDFLPVMREKGDSSAADHLAAQSAQLLANLETHAWDGQWYRRAYYDDGTPLGSRDSDECRIDSLSQSWSVFAGANRQRARLAMEAVWNELVRERARLVLLLTPPFDKTPHDPGYIKGYLPGIRENGGQYTHAALWTIQAFAKLGDHDRAIELFDLINPVLHTDSPEGVMRYQVEPYVVAADVYGVAPHTGRGGWTWYTGSAAWMYRVALETILGLDLRGDRLALRPCIPADWPEFELTVRWGSAVYRIVYRNGPQSDAPQLLLDGEPINSSEVRLVDDGGQHEVLFDCSSSGQASAAQASAAQASPDQKRESPAGSGSDRSAASRVR